MNTALLIDEFLKDKVDLRDFDHDALSVVDNQIVFWDFKNIPCPTMEELEALSPAVASKIQQDQINAEALKYLAETDWYVIRQMDSGEAMPEDVKAKRAEARLKVVR